MLQFINDLPENIVGIHAVGEVTKEDIDTVLIPRLDDLVKRQGEINYLLVLETDAQNFTAGAWFNDVKVGLKHFTKWKKVAVATDQKSVEWFTNHIFKYLIPGKAQGFSLDKLEDAVKWISED
ncbi:STAS/SEC14 domain-containing protein [Mucilaginibacter terrae]|uniref:STAS/SEC14 domain-containing protein n=1 Tax=Mucilaginibacter terrae TaxID=1955052 RepID=UPI00362AD2D8